MQAQQTCGADEIFVQDVTRYEDWQQLYAYVKEVFGDLDVLVNNAGGGISIRPIEEQTPEIIDRILQLNLASVIYESNRTAPLNYNIKKEIKT